MISARDHSTGALPDFNISVGETADWVLAELSDYGYGVTSEEIC